MKRFGPQSRWQNRKPSAFPQVLRTLQTPRGTVLQVVIRQPEPNEITLSDAEILHGVRANLIAPVALRMFRTAEKGGRP